MTVKIDGTNTVANPAFTGADTDTGLQCGTDELKLVTGGTARATVDSSGNVGVGGSAAPTSSVYNTATLHLRQASSNGSQLRMTTATSGHTTDDGVHISFWNDNNLYVYNKEAAGHVVFGAGNATQGRFTADGLCFGNDTAAANALDDYEEGEFTPTVKGQTTAGTATYTQQHGKYTKIGDRVIVNGYVAWDDATGSGALLIAGLPVPSLSHQYRGIQSGSAMLQSMAFAAGSTSVTTYLPENSQELQVYISGTGQTWAQHGISTAGSLIWQLTYVTAS